MVSTSFVCGPRVHQTRHHQLSDVKEEEWKQGLWGPSDSTPKISPFTSQTKFSETLLSHQENVKGFHRGALAKTKRLHFKNALV